ncbi:MAG: signal recognition particle-docking protein FtsY [Syntrophomonadaceae bacterium]|nr:signal recognition particle-docking protein FtsY [Syntrophomonadaceae bacterium]
MFDRFKGKKQQDESQLQPEAASIPEEKGNGSEEASSSKTGWLSRFKKGLQKTRQNLSGRLESLIKHSDRIDDDFWDEVEEILIQADVGVETSLELVNKVRQEVKKQKLQEPEQVLELIRQEAADMLKLEESSELCFSEDGPSVILVVGVNGAGKTTSIAKLAYQFKQQDKRVLLAAGDTFRAAAIDQLQIWADRIGVDLIKHQEGADPGAVVFDALNAARARRADCLIIDTAGRLQNKTNLMKEISKVRKIIEREIPGAPHEVLLVLDATTGQNAISQAKVFTEATGVSGIILTKLDGTAKGGIVLAIARELQIPVKFIGIGEGMEDLKPFAADMFAAALFDRSAEEE